MEVNTPTILIRQRDLAPTDCSIYYHVKWLGGTDQLDDPREGDGDAPTLQTKVEILGRTILDGSISDKPFAVESNKA